MVSWLFVLVGICFWGTAFFYFLVVYYYRIFWNLRIASLFWSDWVKLVRWVPDFRLLNCCLMCCFSTLWSIGRTSRASLHCASVCFFQQFWGATLLQIYQSWALPVGLVQWVKILSHLRSFFTCGDLLSGVYTPAYVISSLRDFALVKFL